MRIVVLLSAAGGGDRQPVIALACAMRTRGHEVTFVCDAATADLVSTTGIGTIINNVEQVGFISGWVRELAENSAPPNPFVVWGDLAAPSIRDSVSGLRPDLIVSALFTMGLAGRLARDLSVPWCFVNPSFYFGPGSRQRWEDDWHEPFIPKLARECFAPLVESADIVLHATDPLFDFEPDALPAGHDYVGFLLWEPPLDLPHELDSDGDPWALISASTARPGDEATMLRAAVGGLAELPVRPVLTAPKGGIDDDIGTGAFVAGYLPHGPVLQRSIMSVNQASHGIVSKCLVNGVPMVLLPWDADQPGVANRAVALGVACSLTREEATPAAVERAAGEILSDSGYRERATQVAEILASRTPADTACQLLETV